MKGSKISSRTLFTASIIFELVLVSGPLGYKHGFLLLIPSIISLLVGLLGVILVFFSSLVMLFVAIKYKLISDRKVLLAGLLVSIISFVFYAEREKFELKLLIELVFQHRTRNH